MITYDLIVVGGGILGAAHAFSAAKLGKKVLILEKDNFPVGSTVRNFGQIVPSGLTGKWFEHGLRSLEIYTDIQKKTDLSIQKNGSVYVASDNHEMQLVHELSSHHRSTGYACTVLNKRLTLEKNPFLNNEYAVGALSFPDELSVNPKVFINRFLALITEQYGVDFKPNESAIDINEIKSNLSAITTSSKKVFIAEKVIVCCGYTLNLLFPDELRNAQMKISKLQMMQTVPMRKIDLTGNVLTGLTIRRYESFAAMPSSQNNTIPVQLQELANWGIHLLFKQEADGSIIIGDSHEYTSAATFDSLGFDSREHIDNLILKEANRILRLPITKIDRKWTGFYAQHENEIFIEQIGTNIQICTGIGGKGMTSSLGFAEKNIGTFLSL